MIRLAATASALALLAGAASAEYALTILHTNDFHARFEPITKFDSTCREEDNQKGECFGGWARLATAVREARASTDNAILVDGGDQFQGTLYYTQYKGTLTAEMMNALGYDAMTVGNHEFDDGPEVLRAFLDAVGFPVLMANADVSREPALAGVIRKSVVLERGGERLGLIGLTPQDTPDLASPGRNITFTDPVPAVAHEVERLAAEGVNKIIVLSHSGFGVDRSLAEAVPGIDVIVGGHTNTLLSNRQERAEGPYPFMVGTTAIVSAYAYGKFLGRLDVTFDDRGTIVSATGEPLLLDRDVAEEAAVKARLAEAAKPLQEVLRKVVAVSAAPIDGSRESCRTKECEMGNLVAEAMLDRVKGQGITIAIQNGGGLRASIDAGEVTMGEVLTVLPFQNTLATFELRGAEILAALENGVSQVEEGAGRFPQVAGLRYSWTRSAPAGSRVKEVLVAEGGAWVPLDPEKVYGVVSNNFMRAGGDGYRVFTTAMNAYDFGPGLEAVVAEYLAAQGGYRPFTDGRIREE